MSLRAEHTRLQENDLALFGEVLAGIARLASTKQVHLFKPIEDLIKGLNPSPPIKEPTEGELFLDKLRDDHLTSYHTVMNTPVPHLSAEVDTEIQWMQSNVYPPAVLSSLELVALAHFRARDRAHEEKLFNDMKEQDVMKEQSVKKNKKKRIRKDQA